MNNISAAARHGLDRVSARFRRWRQTQPLGVERQKQARKEWGRTKGDLTYRLDYDLRADSLVLDLGGYEGQWASDIYGRYRCRIHIFEPVPSYAEFIAKRFSRNPDIELHRCGLAAKAGEVAFAVDGASSSAYLTGVFSTQRVQMRAVEEFFSSIESDPIDLMKINIEGAEYDLLDRMLELGLHRRVRDLQVQFHKFVPQAEKRAEEIAARLGATHELSYQFYFVWENWRLRRGVAPSDRPPPSVEVSHVP
jgi:FkbM family methyltransferase